MMEEIIFNQGINFNFSIVLLLFQLVLSSTIHTEFYWLIFYSIVIVLILLFTYISLIKIPRDANKYLKETYPYWDMV